MRILTYMLIIAIGGLLACEESHTPEGTPNTQYASSVISFSSQLGNANWFASQTLGASNVFPFYGNIAGSWSPSTADGQREYIVLGFNTLQSVRIIEIFETFNPGSIDTVYVRNAATQTWKKVYSRPAKVLPEVARKFNIYFTETEFNVDAVRIAMNSPEVPGSNQVDAVAISGFIKE